MSKHTPGPWTSGLRCGYEVRPEAPARGWSIGFAPIAKVHGDSRIVADGEREANARLIAAAPELLQLVRAIVDGRSACFIPTDDPSKPTFDWDELASAAIAKATVDG
mgnify:CR=1 FL=1